MLSEQCAAGTEVHPRLQERTVRTRRGRQEHDEGAESSGRRAVIRRTYIELRRRVTPYKDAALHRTKTPRSCSAFVSNFWTVIIKTSMRTQEFTSTKFGHKRLL